MEVVTLQVAVAVAAAALMVGLAKGGVGGIGPVITLVVATVMPTRVAVGLMLPILMTGDLFALWAHWRRWDLEAVRALLPSAVAGVAIASVFLRSVSERGLELFIVAISLGFAVYRVFEGRIRSRPPTIRPVHGVLAGTTAGITSTVAHVGGPPVSVYLLAKRVEPRQFVATSALLFTVINWTKVPGYVVAGLFDAELMRALWPALILIPPGILAGRWFVVHVPARVFDGLVLVSLVGGSILLLL